MFFTLFLVFFIIIILCVCYKQPAVAKVPVHPGSLPIVGHIFKLAAVRDYFKFFILDAAKFVNENGGVTAMKSPFATLYFISNLEDATYILEQCLDKMFVYKFLSRYIGDTFFSAEVPIWKQNRNLLSRALKPSLCVDYLDVINEQAKLLTQELENKVDKGYINMKDMFFLNNLQTACIVAFGSKTGADNKTIQAVNDLLTSLMIRLRRIALYPEFTFKFSKLKKMQDESLECIDMKTKMFMDENIKRYNEAKNNFNINSEAPKFRSTLDLVLDTVTDKGCSVPENDLRNLMKSVVFAQSDTSYRLMINLFICIGSYPQVQEKIYQEIMDVIGEEELVTKEHLNKMTYVDAVVKEAARYIPIVPLLGRQSNKEIKLSNATIPPGGQFIVHVWAINRSTKYWGPDAKEFKPERWLNPESFNPNAFLSFSLGTRNCMDNYMDILCPYNCLQGIWSANEWSLPTLRRVVLGSRWMDLKSFMGDDRLLEGCYYYYLMAI